MGKLPSIKNLILEDFQDQKSWISKLIYPINSFMELVFLNLNRGLTFSENMLSFVETVDVVGDQYPVKFTNKLKVKPLGLWVIGCYQSDSYGTSITNAVYADWRYNQSNQVEINSITGLTSGVKYKLTMIIVGG